MRSALTAFFIITALLVLYSPAVSDEQVEHQRFLERALVWEARLEGLEYVPDEIIVEFSDTRSLSTLESGALEGFAISDLFQYRPVAVFRMDGRESLAEGMARLEGTPGIKSVSPNLIRHCTYAPNDPLYGSQEYLAPIRSEAAWDITTGSASVRVAVIDTGMDVNHPELAGRVIYKQNLRDPGSIGSDNVFDDSGHGTAVAGIIGATGNNGARIAGLSWDVRLMAFRACGGEMLSCTIANEIEAIDSAVAHGAQIINLSLGGKGTNTLEGEAVENAYNSGVIMVAAAGNDGELLKSTGIPEQDYLTMFYPASYPQVIGVAAMDNESGAVKDRALLTRAQFSNYGEDLVSVAAVGTSVMTTVPYMPVDQVPYAFYTVPNYTRLDGTSFACPQVVGTAALILSLNADLKPLDVRRMIENTAFPTGGPDENHNNVDDYLGHGIIDVGAAVAAGSGKTSLQENGDFRVGVFPSPLFVDDVMVIVECKRSSDGAPSVTYFVNATAENGSVAMERLPSQTDTWVGQFRTNATGGITINVSGSLGGYPLDPISFVYSLGD